MCSSIIFIKCQSKKYYEESALVSLSTKNINSTETPNYKWKSIQAPIPSFLQKRGILKNSTKLLSFRDNITQDAVLLNCIKLSLRPQSKTI